ncbi:unnamed protein product, partial [Coccothraustes coccothraustes]
MATGERPPRDRGGGREGRRLHVTAGDARLRSLSPVTWCWPHPRRPAARSEPPARGAGERRCRSGRGARSASRPRCPSDPSPGAAGPRRDGAAAAFGLPRFLPARRTCDGSWAGAAVREGTKGTAAPPICAPRGRGETAALRRRHRCRGTGLGPARAADKGVPWQRLPRLLPGRPRRNRAGVLGPVSWQGDIPPGAWVMRIRGRPGWPLRTVHAPRRARDKRHCCHSSIPLTDPCRPAGRCSARSRSWQRPCAAAGQTGPLAQIFRDSAVACGERKPSNRKACIDLSELACQPVPTLAKSGLL